MSYASSDLQVYSKFQYLSGISPAVGNPPAQAPGVTTVLVWNPVTQTWGPHVSVPSGSTNLIMNDLLDVQHVSPPTDGHVLTWVTANNQWESLAPALPVGLVPSINRTNDGQLFEINKVDAVPAAGQIVFSDGTNNVGPESGSVSEVRISKDDLNAMASLWPQIHPDNTRFSVVGQFDDGDTSFRQWNFTKGAGLTDNTTYWTFAANGDGGLGVFSHLDKLLISRVPLDADVQYKIESPIAGSFVLDFDGAGVTVVGTAAVNTWYQIPLTGWGTAGANGVSVSTNNFLVTYPYPSQCRVEWNAQMFANVADTVCEIALYKNGVIVSNSQCVCYTKNSTTVPETSMSRSIIDPSVSNTDTFSLWVRVSEDNSPDPNPTQITVKHAGFSISSV